MGLADFNNFGFNSVTVEFDCDKCAAHVQSESIEIPSYNTAADNNMDSYNYEEGAASCPECHKDFEITVGSGMNGGYVEIEEVNDDTITVNTI